MTHETMLNAIADYCKAHPFYEQASRNEIHDENGGLIGFNGYYPNYCAITVQDSAVRVVVHACDLDDLSHAHYYIKISESGWFEGVEGEEFQYLTRKQKACMICIAINIIAALNAQLGAEKIDALYTK